MRKCITCLKCHTYFNVWQRLVGAMWIPPFGKKNSKCANCVHMSLCPAGLQLHMSKSSIMTCLWAQNRIWTGGHEGQSPFTDSHLQQEWYWWRRPQEVRIREVIIITEACLCSVLYRIVFCLFFSFYKLINTTGFKLNKNESERWQKFFTPFKLQNSHYMDRVVILFC